MLRLSVVDRMRWKVTGWGEVADCQTGNKCEMCAQKSGHVEEGHACFCAFERSVLNSLGDWSRCPIHKPLGQQLRPAGTWQCAGDTFPPLALAMHGSQRRTPPKKCISFLRFHQTDV